MAKRACFMCNGTGQMCGDCGEAVNVCKCDDGPRESDCESCGGNGIAPLDQDENDKNRKEP